MKQQDLPPYDRENEKIDVWNNCCYVYGPHILGRIYFNKDDTWELIASDVRHYYVGPYDISVMPYYDKRGYALFDTANTVETYLLDCETGKIVYQGYFERSLTLRLGMSDDHQNSCFIFKICLGNDDFESYLLTDYQGKTVLNERYVGKGKKISFLLSEPLIGHIYLIRFEKEGKCSILRYSKGKVRQIIEPKYDEIIYCGESVDRQGIIHTTTFKALRRNRKAKAKEESYYDLDGKKIEM